LVIDDLITTGKVNNMNENVDDAIAYSLMKIRKRINKVLIQNLVKGVLGHSPEDQ
jgi:hypothetical protein